MISLQTQNMLRFLLDEIPFYENYKFSDTVFELLSKNLRMIGLFPIKKDEPNRIIAILAESSTSSFHIVGGTFPHNKLEFESFANEYPHTNYFECELAENFGYIPQNHPWLRPVRKQNKILGKEPYQFYKLLGDEVHEVAVGPIHAGVIEPGHFRFQCHGELVHHLEINLGYQHRGIEKMILEKTPNQRIILAESIAGDTVIGHTYAHCALIESLSNTQITLRAQLIRSISEELERIAMHIAGLIGVANDVGFAIVSASYGRLRTLVINTLALLCGSRFGRGLFLYGGVRFDFDDKIIKKAVQNLELVRKDIKIIDDYLFSSTGALIRFEETGIVTEDLAQKIGLTGIAARSSGVETDTRTYFPYGAYHYFPISTLTLDSGDVFARARLRSLEIEESFQFIFEQIKNLPIGEIQTKPGEILPKSGAISMVEGWRGEILHIGLTDESGNIIEYKIKDPSFNNWYGLGLALRRTAISDFPLCNKSFDLSYAGHDL